MEVAGYSQLLGRENLLVVLHNLPEEKRSGICQTADQAARGDTGVAANLVEDCIKRCVSYPCLMFGVVDEDDRCILRYFTRHDPEY